jgi:hypothetical protein
LYQTFVRKARLLQAMKFRKFVAPPTPVETSAEHGRLADPAI